MRAVLEDGVTDGKAKKDVILSAGKKTKKQQPSEQ
jgi:hypothetical protein